MEGWPDGEDPGSIGLAGQPLLLELGPRSLSKLWQAHGTPCNGLSEAQKKARH